MILVAAMGLTFGSQAMGQTTDAATRKAARLLADQGLALFDKGKYREALVKFDQADALVDAPTVDLFAARCLVQLGQFVEASRRYKEVTQAELKEDASKIFKEAIGEAKEELAALLPRIASIEIVVEGGSRDASVWVDGKEVTSQLGEKVEVNPGDHKVEGKRGDQSAVEEFTLKDGEKKLVALKLPMPVTVSQDKPRIVIPPTDPDRGKTQRMLGYIGLGVGGLGAALWATTGVIALGQKSFLTEQGCKEGQCPVGVDTSSYTGLRTVSTIGFWAGVIGAGAGAALLLTAPSPSGQASITPWIGVASAGMKGAF